MFKSWFGKDNEHAGNIDEHNNICDNDGSPIGWISNGVVYDKHGKAIGEQIGSELRGFNGEYLEAYNSSLPPLLIKLISKCLSAFFYI
jgi:hypothetical protein